MNQEVFKKFSENLKKIIAKTTVIYTGIIKYSTNVWIVIQAKLIPKREEKDEKNK